jgi:hypothetical protein
MNIFIKTTTFGQNKKLEEWPHFTFLEIPLTSGLPNCHCKLPNKMVNGISLGFTLESTDKALTYFAKKCFFNHKTGTISERVLRMRTVYVGV